MKRIEGEKISFVTKSKVVSNGWFGKPEKVAESRRNPGRRRE
jgi:hypothetical protein